MKSKGMSGKRMDASSTGSLKTGPDKNDGAPGKKATPIDRGERKPGKSPMRKGK